MSSNRRSGVRGAGKPRRERWLLVAAILLLAVADAASGDSAGQPGTPRPPDVAISSPRHLTVVTAASFEIAGVFAGQVDRIDVLVDGQSLGRALPDDDAGEWRLPAPSVHLTPGPHEIAARAFGQAGSRRDAIRIFHQPSGPGYAITVDPDRLTIRPGDPGADRAEADIQTYGSPTDSQRVALAAASTPAGLDLSMAPPQVTAGSTAGLLVRAGDAPPGTYEVTVTAEGADGGAPQQLTVVVTVQGTPPPPTTTTTTQPTATTAAPRAVRYDVQSVVTASDVGGVANEGEATWVFTWPCADGRCEGRVEDGGPRGRVGFDYAYDATSETFAFDFVLDNPENANCPTNHLTGTITPTSWDATGPIGFAYRLDSVLMCTTGDSSVSWEGTGTRAG